jgi:hypothetical protein
VSPTETRLSACLSSSTKSEDLTPFKRRLPWVLSPLHDINQQRPLIVQKSHPPHYVPPSAFLTPSTAYSATGLAGLFHPTAAFRVRPSGVYPSLRSRAGFLRSGALLPLLEQPLGPKTLPVHSTSTSRPCSPLRVRWFRNAVKHSSTPRPSWVFLPPPGVPLPRRQQLLQATFRPRPWLVRARTTWSSTSYRRGIRLV